MLPLVTPVGAQTDATWTGGAAGNWSNGSQWSTNPNYPQNGLPGPGDTYNAILGGNYSVTLTEDITIERLTSSGLFTLSGGFELNLNNGFELNSVFNRTLNGVTLNLLGGTSLFTGTGGLYMANGAVINNHSILEWRTIADVTYTEGAGVEINNLPGATFRKAVSAGSLFIGNGFTLNNNGVIDIDAGELELGGGTYNLGDGTAFTGAGMTLALSGNFTLSGTLTADQNFEFAGGFFGGTHTLSGGTWRMSGGFLQGPGTTVIASGATLSLLGSTPKNLSGRTLRNEGSLSLGGSGIFNLVGNSTLQNNALLDIQGDADFGYGGESPVIQNTATGTFRKSAGTGISTVNAGIVLNNAGLVAAQSGTIQFASGSYVHQGGTLRVENGATIQFLASPTLTSGRLEGQGTIFAPTVFASGATVSPGLSAGQLNILGNLNLGSVATLSIEIGGTDPGVTHDFLNVSGSVAAGGFLEIALLGEFTPTAGMSFTVVDAGSTITGSFANAPSGERVRFGDGATFLVQYGAGTSFPDRVVLSEYSPVPEPGTMAWVGGTGLLAWAGARRFRRLRGAARPNA